MKPVVRAPAKITPVRAAVLSTMLMSIGLGAALADPMENKGTTPYVTHFIFRPVQSLQVLLVSVQRLCWRWWEPPRT